MYIYKNRSRMDDNEDLQKKKRGRKKKVNKTPLEVDIEKKTNIVMVIEELESELEETADLQVIKKRGRKPNPANIILHLKCSMLDLNEHNNKINQIMKDPLSYNPVVPPSIMTYNVSSSTAFAMYNNDADAAVEKNVNDAVSGLAYEDGLPKKNIIGSICQSCNEKITEVQETDTTEVNMKEINTKLKNLKIQLYKNVSPDKKSACFWCTYEYDNQSCYIPKYENDGELHGYGSFCRPECAVAFLMKENIDDSVKFERYHLLNQVYSKVYKFKKNIKPAPNPYYLLEKYYGNLTIQEYRKLLKTEHMLLVIDKPMTRILPELHEDNDDFIMNIYGGSAGGGGGGTAGGSNQNIGVYKVKRQSEKQKGPSKNSIMKQNFGISA